MSVPEIRPMTTSQRKYSRRAMLKSLGAGLGLLPLLEADGSIAAEPQRKRLLLVIAPNGIHHGHWVNGVNAEWLPNAPGGDLTQATFPEITSPLVKHKARMSVLQLNLANAMAYGKKFGGHESYAAVFSGCPAATRANEFPGNPFYPVKPTVDQFIADETLKRLPQYVRSIHLAALTDSDKGLHLGNQRAFWRGDNQPVTPEHSPYKAADGLFSGGPSMTEDPRLARLRAERKTILDVLGRDLERYAKNLGTADKQRVQGHLHAVQDLQRLLLGPKPKDSACAAPRATPIDFMANDNFPAVVDAHFKLLQIAFRCDVTRVATLQLANSHGNGLVFSWLGISGPGVDPLGGPAPIRAMHDISHVPVRGGKNEKAIVDKWFMTKLADLIDLFEVEEGDKKLLDSSAIVWTSSMEDGGGHLTTGVPFFVAGSCGGYLKMGRVFGGPWGTTYAPANGLLTGLCNAMDCPVAWYGDETHGGELAGLRA